MPCIVGDGCHVIPDRCWKSHDDIKLIVGVRLSIVMDSTTEPNTMNESLANDEQTDCPVKCSDGIQTNTETEQFQNG